MDSSIAPMGGHLGGPIVGSRPDRSSSSSSSSHQGPIPVGSSSIASVEVTRGATTGGSMKVCEVFPDLHHKMSKKIAQLTKVIYHLNTKNEDRQARD